MLILVDRTELAIGSYASFGIAMSLHFPPRACVLCRDFHWHGAFSTAVNADRGGKWVPIHATRSTRQESFALLSFPWLVGDYRPLDFPRDSIVRSDAPVAVIRNGLTEQWGGNIILKNIVQTI